MFGIAIQGMFVRCALGVSVAAACSLAQGQAQEPWARTRDRVQTVLKAAHLAGDFYGAALVALDGKIVYQGAFGPADAEWNVPNAPDVHHGIASLTKSFTAHVVMALVDRGTVKLDDALSVHMPEFQGRRIGGITLRQLLSHTAGIGDHLQFVNEEIPAETSKRWEGFSGASIAVTKKSFEQNLRDLLLEPAKMAASGMNHRKTILPRRARSYRLENGALQNAPWDDSGSHFSAGGMYSTVGDLYRWDRALRAGSVVSKAAQASMTTLVIVALANVSSVPSMNKYVPALIEAVAAHAAPSPK